MKTAEVIFDIANELAANFNVGIALAFLVAVVKYGFYLLAFSAIGGGIL